MEDEERCRPLAADLITGQSPQRPNTYVWIRRLRD